MHLYYLRDEKPNATFLILYQPKEQLTFFTVRSEIKQAIVSDFSDSLKAKCQFHFIWNHIINENHSEDKYIPLNIHDN